MTDFQAWKPPAGELVDPPVHPLTVVDVIWSDRSEGRDRAENLNWSSFGDGPKIIAYSVVDEYVEKREPWEGWAMLRSGYLVAASQCREDFGKPRDGEELIHVREVLPEPPLDLTKITTPFGLLDEATQAALKAHGGPYEYWHGMNWMTFRGTPGWSGSFVHRVAPSAAPAKPAPDRTVDQIIADTGSEIDAIFAKAKPSPREVVAWAAVKGDTFHHQHVFYNRSSADAWAAEYGGTVVKLSGFLP